MTRAVTDKAEIQAIVQGHHGNPFSVLGMHGVPGGGVAVCCFLPGATGVEVVDKASGAAVAALERMDDAGFFAGLVPDRPVFPYRLRVHRAGGIDEVEDPYRFGLLLSGQDASRLAEGAHPRLYDVLGAHCREIDGVAGVGFAVWAPNARRVSVVGAFNEWDGRIHPMRLRPECGVWELFLPGLGPGTPYKYQITGPDGTLLPLKADPLAFECEHRPATASVVASPLTEPWHDDAWMTSRDAARNRPISIYEVHLGSWQRVPEEGDRFLTYRELADRLVPYVKDMGFTHIELLPVTEHPFDGSWGYQPLALFAPTSRFGTPDDFKAFVERCHAEGIGVILDWVPGHFPADDHGIARFDGTHLYEHADPRLGRHMDWGTLIYNFGRREVANFLLASALYWLDRFHIDGLRVDAVASMLYLDYSRQPGEWLPNIHGGNENLEAIALLKRVNEQVFGEYPGTTTLAEESTAWPMVSHPTYLGGLGFGFKWNMGWMHDTLRYMAKDPVHRRYHHSDLTFGLVYAFNENFVLPLSHDEVVHGKGSLIGRMAGDRWQRFANLRAYFAFMYTHPGKKLLFMGGEFAQEREWNHDASLDWHLLDDPLHRGMQRLVRDLNHLYRRHPALHERDCEAAGFQWIDAADADQGVLSFLRCGTDPADFTVVVCNMTPLVRTGYRVGVPWNGPYAELLNSDATEYGGSGVGNGGRVTTMPDPRHDRPFTLSLTLPPLAVLVLAPLVEGAPA